MSQPPPPPPGQPPTPPSGGGFGGPKEPQPPANPPGENPGGYGYPQQPPSPPPGGGYGYPQQPPPGAGYGYPQQPPGPPPGGGYGYPAQPGQPGPYGAPGPYGQPGQPPYGQDPGMYPTMPPGGTPPGGRQKTIAIIAASVAALLVVGVGVFFLTQGGDDEGKKESKGGSQGQTGDGGATGGGGGGGTKPANSEGKMLFKVDAPAVDDVTSVPGAWATEKTFAKSSVESVVGVNVADGSEAWKIKLDGEVCVASPQQTDDDKTALVTRETKSSRAKCNQMVVIDLVKGEKLWQETIPGDANVTSLGGGVTISQNTVASAWIGGSVGYAITGGDPLFQARPGQCRDQGFAGGPKLVAVLKCGSYGSEEFKVQTLDPKTGKSVSEFEVPSGVESVSVASTSPLVLGVGAGDTLTTDIMTVSESGKLAARVALGDRYDRPCSTGVEECFGMTVGPDAFYLTTKQHDDSTSDYGQTNEVMAFDLKTGKTKWKADAGSKRTIAPISMDGSTVLAYRKPTYDSGGEVVGLDPETGKETVYLTLPNDSVDFEQDLGPGIGSQETEVIFEHGRLFLQEQLISERPGAFTDERLLAAGFGSG